MNVFYVFFVLRWNHFEHTKQYMKLKIELINKANDDNPKYLCLSDLFLILFLEELFNGTNKKFNQFIYLFILLTVKM